MTNDQEILKELFLPLLEEMAAHSSMPEDERSRGEAFWTGLSTALFGTPGQLREMFADNKILGIEQYARQIEDLKAEYIAWLAQYYCTGHVCAAIKLLLDRSDAAFAEEVAFQKHMMTAVTRTGRAALREEMELWDEFADTDISDDEIATAFRSIQTNAERSELKRQLRQFDGNELPLPEKKKKRIGTIPLFFLRFAAAAAVGSVATVGVVKVYKNSHRQDTLASKHHVLTDSNKMALNPAPSDTIAKPDTLRPAIVLVTHHPDSAKAGVMSPHVVLKGKVEDTAGNKLVTGVTITLLDDKGKEQIVFSKDGKFRFSLPLHRDFAVSGKKDGYHSARLSLSTKDAKEADSGEVIEVILHFSKDPVR